MRQSAIVSVMFAFLVVAFVVFRLFDQVIGIAVGAAGFVVVMVLLVATKEMQDADRIRHSSRDSNDGSGD